MHGKGLPGDAGSHTKQCQCSCSTFPFQCLLVYFVVVYSSTHSLTRRAPCFWWESVVMLRKLLCAATLVLLSNQRLEAQLTTMALVLLLALLLHLMVHPFKDRALETNPACYIWYTATSMNVLETMSLIATLATLFGCIMLGVMEAGEAARIVVTMMIFIGNCLVVLYFLWALAVEYMHTTRREADVFMRG